MSYFMFMFLSSILTFIGLFSKTNGGTFSVDYSNHQFLKDGKPFQYISGSVHYFRIHPDLWEDRLKRVRALGFNAIQTYIDWHLHEPVEGTFDFLSPGLNITKFFSLAQQNGLYVLLRPGPYICSETDFGALPWWLLKHQGIKLRTYEPNYINAVTNYYNKLLDVIKPMLYKNGGPILMVQVENEYGVLDVCDHSYTQYLRDLIWNKLGNDTVLYTTDQTSSKKISCGKVPGALSTVDFGWSSDDGMIDSYFALQQNYSNGGPKVCSEFWCADGIQWGKNKPTIKKVGAIIENMRYMHSIGASYNLYMLHAGTNFGFNNGGKNEGEHDGQIGTSYGACPAIAENGDITPYAMAIRSFIQNLTNWENPPLDVPGNNPISNYGQVPLKRVGQNLISTLTLLQEPCVQSIYPLTFEQIDHGYGYVLYSTTIKSSGTNLTANNIRDFGYVFVNNVYQGMVGNRLVTTKTLQLSTTPGDILRILVENGGRENYWDGYLPALEYRGLFNVTLDGVTLQDWYQCGINTTEASINSFANSTFFEQVFDIVSADAASSQPGVYIGYFNSNVSQDTFFDSTGLGKGQLFVNGFNVGRYWPLAGPQMTLYVPGPVIKQRNVVMLIELIGNQQSYVNFIDHPIFYNGYNVNFWGCLLE